MGGTHEEVCRGGFQNGYRGEYPAHDGHLGGWAQIRDPVRIGGGSGGNPIGGGMGMRFTCFINGVTTYVYFENPKWFVDAKEDW